MLLLAITGQNLRLVGVVFDHTYLEETKEKRFLL
jgi:hypothetical protein